MMYQGDIALNQVLYFTFTTQVSGLPTSLAGTPVVSVYKDDVTVETTVGVTLVADFDGRTGLNNVKIDTADAFYTAGHDYSVVITTGTVGGTSAIGYKVASFSINNRTALRPTVAGRTLDVASTGETGLDFDNIKDATGAHTLTNITVPITTGVTNPVTTTYQIKKNTALANFEFPMFDSTNHNPITGLGAGVTGEVSKDGGAFGALTNAVSEVASGIYKVSLAAADLNANCLTLKFTAAGADTQFITIVTQT